MLATAQRRSFDCGAAALSAFMSVEYADVFYVAAQVAGTRIRDGLTVQQMIRIAARFQHPLKPVHWRKVDLDEDIGVLGVKWNDKPRWADGHWVVIRRGTLIDPDPSTFRIWDADVWMHQQKARPGTLLVERG